MAAVSGCGSDRGAANGPGNNDRTFLFGMKSDSEGKEDFVAVTSNSAVIADVVSQLARPVEDRTRHINGRIERGNGGHNLGWSWHFTPDEWALTAESVELCDGTPTLVEQDLAYWVDIVGSFCPWDSYVKSEITTLQ
jgi:hypothetical protein